MLSIEQSCIEYTKLIMTGKITCTRKDDKLKVTLYGKAFQVTTAFKIAEIREMRIPNMVTAIYNCFQLADNHLANSVQNAREMNQTFIRKAFYTIGADSTLFTN